MENKIKAGIIGGAGYTGGEMVRVLLNHPSVNIMFVQSSSNAGKPLQFVHRDLDGETDMEFADSFSLDIDVLFLCLGHGDAKKFLEANKINETIRVIDLSQDFRLSGQSFSAGRQFTYGLPELNRDSIRSAHDIANPGCFATAIQLGLLPLAQAGLLNEVYTTGITGSTGAGQSLSQTGHFSWRANNIQAYKSLQHQHLHEIGQSLSQLQAAPGTSINFVPWRGDFTRGIFISSQLKCTVPIESLNELYEEYYATHPFVRISKEAIFLKQVVNTNNCLIQLEKSGDNLVVHSAIDNLLKGASGQAVQNMNLLFGLDETAGLKLKAAYF